MMHKSTMFMNGRWMIILASLLGALGVMSGAFGAHALQGVLSVQAQGWYDTATTYHAGHALALLACGLLALHTGTGPGSGWLRIAGICFVIGTFIFSGTLYAMAFTGITRLGMITPVGGVLLIVAWCALAVAASRLRST